MYTFITVDFLSLIFFLTDSLDSRLLLLYCMSAVQRFFFSCLYLLIYLLLKKRRYEYSTLAVVYEMHVAL